MSFSQDEIEALVLGLREVQAVADQVLTQAAQNALAKLHAILPASQRHQLKHASLHAKRFHHRPEICIDVAALRAAIRAEHAVRIEYADHAGKYSSREIYPLGIVFFESTLVVSSWCLLRQDFRTFRLDRIKSFAETGQSFRPKRVPLLRELFAKFKAESQSSEYKAAH